MRYLPKTWKGWIFWLIVVGIVGLITFRAVFLWLYPDAPAYADQCVWDGCPPGDPPWTKMPTPLKRLLNN